VVKGRQGAEGREGGQGAEGREGGEGGQGPSLSGGTLSKAHPCGKKGPYLSERQHELVPAHKEARQSSKDNS
jgi:hypothetical protein